MSNWKRINKSDRKKRIAVSKNLGLISNRLNKILVDSITTRLSYSLEKDSYFPEVIIRKHKILTMR